MPTAAFVLYDTNFVLLNIITIHNCIMCIIAKVLILPLD